MLYKNKIRHGYRYVYGADHVEATLTARFKDGWLFLDRIVNPPEPDTELAVMREGVDEMKMRAGLKP